MALAFTPGTAWAPIADSKTVRAGMELPFGFSVSIGQIANSFNITRGGEVVAGLSTVCTPLVEEGGETDVDGLGGQSESASTSEIHVVNSTFTQGTINITIDSTPLQVPDGSHPVFSGFSALSLLLLAPSARRD